MSTAADAVAAAVGAGLGTATIWFPITYFAARNSLRLRKELGRAWLPYLYCVLAFAVLHFLGLSPSTETTLGLTAFFVVPLAVCAAILYATFRAPDAPSNQPP